MTNFKIGRRNFMVGAQALAAASMLPGFAGRAFAQNVADITYITPFGYLIAFSEVMYADTGGFFEKNGLNVTIEGGRGSSMAVQQVTAGNALCSRTGGTDLIKAYASDPSVVAVGEILQRDAFYLISSQDAPIESAADLAGKTIGIVSAAGATENILDMMLAATDIPKEDVARQVVGNAPTAFEFVKQGRIDAYIATDDTRFQLESDGQPILAWSTDDVALCPGQVYMTSRSQLEASHQNLANFLAGVHDSLGAMLEADDLEPIVDSMMQEYAVVEASRPDKGVSTLNNSLGNYKKSYAEDLGTSEERWNSAYELMVKAGLIPELEERNFYDDSARSLAFS